MAVFDSRYRQPGTALAPVGNMSKADVVSPNFDDWQLCIHPEWFARLKNTVEKKPLSSASIDAIVELAKSSLLCCPEDHQCVHADCVRDRYLCPQCKVPICRSCQLFLQQNSVGPEMLINDNWIGYIEDFIYQKEVTWMEKTVTSPYWTSLTLFSLGSRNSQGHLRKRHKLHDAMYASEQRTAFKGQLYSAPMDWRSIVDQLQTLENDVRIVDLPVIGELLEKKVKISITSGLVDLNKYIKQATVRYSIMVRLIAMHHAAGEADYRYVNMKNVEERAKVLNPTDEAIIPDCLRHALDESEVRSWTMPPIKLQLPLNVLLLMNAYNERWIAPVL